MTNSLFHFAVFSLPLAAQILTLSPQGAQSLRALTGQRIPSVQIVSAVVCPASDAGEVRTPLPAGRVYAAAVSARFIPIPPQFAIPLIQRVVAGNWRNKVLEGVQVLSIAAAGLTASGVIHASMVWTVGLTTGHSAIDYLSDRMRARLPDAGPLVAALLDPESKIDLSDGCKSTALLSLFGRGIQNTAVRMDLAAKIGAP